MPRIEFPRFAAAVLLVLAAGFLAACGGSDDPEQADATVPVQTQQRAPEITVPTTPQTTATTTVPTTPQTTPAAPPQTTPTEPQQPQTTATQPPETGGAAAPRRTPSQETGGATGPSSCGDVANGFISGVQASGAACGEATSVANEWLGSVGESGPEGDVVAGGYACSGSRSGDSTSITCVGDGGRRITFSANN